MWGTATRSTISPIIDPIRNSINRFTLSSFFVHFQTFLTFNAILTCFSYFLGLRKEFINHTLPVPAWASTIGSEK
jgi:hypothetical protein